MAVRGEETAERLSKGKTRGDPEEHGGKRKEKGRGREVIKEAGGTQAKATWDYLHKRI